MHRCNGCRHVMRFYSNLSGEFPFRPSHSLSTSLFRSVSSRIYRKIRRSDGEVDQLIEGSEEEGCSRKLQSILQEQEGKEGQKESAEFDGCENSHKGNQD
ncbi:unnamed protein product [Bursaphelenchus xylophilus]|uniref:(pine wood nematode) hypothetical protein n=1 Tax=Bursaphelenchus xylophilus TaxID=6326 RepID=A0A1I7RRA0_BURXY|nr:unnamed protein product [Bursaphelenchus xylophilus]CAG9130888.1 unnamed protein product [Bursaphelenchus xylophilus]